MSHAIATHTNNSPAVCSDHTTSCSYTVAVCGVLSAYLVLLHLQAMCNQYRAPFEREFAQEETVKVLELSLLDKALFRLLRGWVRRNLRKTLPPQRHVSLRSQIYASSHHHAITELTHGVQ